MVKFFSFMLVDVCCLLKVPGLHFIFSFSLFFFFCFSFNALLFSF